MKGWELEGWEWSGPGFLSVTQLAMERAGSASSAFSAVFDGQPDPWLHPHTLSDYYYAKQHHFLQPRPHTHSKASLCPPAANACNFCANEEPRLRANTPLYARSIIGFKSIWQREDAPFSGRTRGKERLDEAGWESFKVSGPYQPKNDDPKEKRQSLCLWKCLFCTDSLGDLGELFYFALPEFPCKN